MGKFSEENDDWKVSFEIVKLKKKNYIKTKQKDKCTLVDWDGSITIALTKANVIDRLETAEQLPFVISLKKIVRFKPIINDKRYWFPIINDFFLGFFRC